MLSMGDFTPDPRPLLLFLVLGAVLIALGVEGIASCEPTDVVPCCREVHRCR